MPAIEESLIQRIQAGGEVSVERALFTLSGLRADEEFRAYSDKLSHIHGKYVAKLKRARPCAFVFSPDHLAGITPLDRARGLFDHLWDFNPRRAGRNFFLTDVIDAHLGLPESEGVGSCVGLTSLYTVLGAREGLGLSILVSADHMMTRLREGGAVVDIEHTDRLGFDTRDAGQGFRELDAIYLAASVLNSRGMARERAGEPRAALKDYLAAARVNPEYATAHNNLGSVRQKLGETAVALGHYDRALELDPFFVEAYANRGELRARLGEPRGAVADHTRAIELDNTYARAFFGRGLAKRSLGDEKGAADDFAAAAGLNPDYLGLAP